eukprot:1160750-Pelagomonas_calceolata.AAC.7
MYLPAAHVHFGPQKPKINEPPAARPAGVRSLAETSLCADSAAGGAEVPQPPPPHPSHRVEQTLMPELLPPAPAPPRRIELVEVDNPPTLLDMLLPA